MTYGLCQIPANFFRFSSLQAKLNKALCLYSLYHHKFSAKKRKLVRLKNVIVILRRTFPNGQDQISHMEAILREIGEKIPNTLKPEEEE